MSTMGFNFKLNLGLNYNMLYINLFFYHIKSHYTSCLVDHPLAYLVLFNACSHMICIDKHYFQNMIVFF